MEGIMESVFFLLIWTYNQYHFKFKLTKNPVSGTILSKNLFFPTLKLIFFHKFSINFLFYF